VLVAVLPPTVFAICVPACLDRTLVSDIVSGKVYPDYTTDLTITGVCLVFFTWGQIVIYRMNDSVVDESLVNKRLAESMEKYASYNLGVAKAFLGVVKLKAERVSRALNSTTKGRAAMEEITAALNPAAQREGILMAAHTLLNSRLGVGHGLTVTYFEREDSYLVPQLAFDGQLRRKPFSFFENHRERFKVDSQEIGCVAVAAARDGHMWIVSDAEKANADTTHPFCWVCSKDEDKIGSMIAVPLSRPGDPMPALRVLTIHADKTGFFSDSEDARKELNLLVDNVKERLLYEIDVDKLLPLCADEVPNDSDDRDPD